MSDTINEEARKKITKARAGLILDQPFFGALALRLEVVESPGCPTGWTNGVQMGYNPDWIMDMNLDKVKGFIAHEVMHLAVGHQARRQHREPGKWNVAGDFAINQILLDSGFVLPDTQCINASYKNMSAEHIYAMLPDSDKGNGHGSLGATGTNSNGDGNGSGNSDPYNDPGGCGGVMDAPSTNGKSKADASDLAQSEIDWKIAATQAAQAAKTMGNLPGAIKEIIQELLEPKLDWRDILRDFVERAARNDYSWKQPNRRFLSQGIILPSLNSKEIGTACVAVDTSGSVSNDELRQFATEVNSILEEYQDITITVIYCDTQVAHVDEFHSVDMPVQMKMHGGGGTDFRPPFKWVRDNIDGKPTCMIYFTDMECNRFPKDPGYPTIWVQTKTMYSGNHWDDPPFGEVVTMDMTGDPNSRRNTQ
jgi:predicted metal-dependent peptidase